MKISGLQKLTLLDFPGHVACTVFFSGCDLRCPFCHNAPLVTEIDSADGMEEEEFFDFLEHRRGIIDGVAITGGEPLLRPAIADFIRRIRGMGYAVKLDTNGTHPDALAELISEGLIDYVAMDIKNSREKYSLTCGVDVDTNAIDESIAIIIGSGIKHEFRTTVVAEYHTDEDFSKIGEWIRGADAYYLQQFRDSGALVGDASRLHAVPAEQMESYAVAARKNVAKVELRGVGKR